MGDSGCGHSLDQAQSDVGGQFLEEAAAVAEKHGNLVKDHLVEQSGAQRSRDDTAPMIAMSRSPATARALSMPALMEVTKVCLSVASGGAGRWLTTMSGAVGCGPAPSKPSESSYVFRPATTAPTRPAQVVEDGAARLEQPEAGEQLARGVAVAVPAEEDAAVTESASGTGIACGDEAVDGDGQ